MLYRVIQAMQQQWEMVVRVPKSLALKSAKQGIPDFNQEYIFLSHIPALKSARNWENMAKLVAEIQQFFIFSGLLAPKPIGSHFLKPNFKIFQVVHFGKEHP